MCFIIIMFGCPQVAWSVALRPAPRYSLIAMFGGAALRSSYAAFGSSTKWPAAVNN
jgi:hypothetical protein